MVLRSLGSDVVDVFHGLELLPSEQKKRRGLARARSEEVYRNPWTFSMLNHRHGGNAQTNQMSLDIFLLLPDGA